MYYIQYDGLVPELVKRKIMLVVVEFPMCSMGENSFQSWMVFGKWCSNAIFGGYCVDTSLRRRSVWGQIHWNKPQAFWAKLNMDGATKGNPSMASGARLLLDNMGACLGGFMYRTGFTS